MRSPADHRLLLSLAMLPLLCGLARGETEEGPAAATLVAVGVSQVDVTPRQPVHLVNETGPKELQGVAQRLYARAIAFGTDSAGPAVLISFDGIGVPRPVGEEVARRVGEQHGIPRERVVVCATHTHWAPHLSGLLPTIYGERLPVEQQERVDQYTQRLTDWLEDAALRALKDRRQRSISWSVGKVTFAANRRLEEDGRLVTGEGLMFTYNPNGPVDHALPVMYVHEPDGTLRSVLFTYACHSVALTGRDLAGFRNQVHGDWTGVAQERIEANYPDCVAIATIGCGGDQRPTPVGGVEVAEHHGRAVAVEVDRLLDDPVSREPLTDVPHGRLQRVALPLTDLPDRETLQEYVTEGKGANRNTRARGFLAEEMLERLDRGERPDDHLPYVVQTWTFGDDLAMIFLAGEVTVEYALRIRSEFDGSRVWPIAYANATPCYIPSKRVLRRGGYEADRSMHYYGLLRRLTPATEDMVLETVQALLPARFGGKEIVSRPNSPD